MTNTRSPKTWPIGNAKLREAALHPGKHDDWDFAYGEFTHTVDNAPKVLFLDPAKRTEVQQTADDSTYFLSSCGNLYPKRALQRYSKVHEVRTKLNELIAKLPAVSYAPVLVENDTPPKTYIHLKGDWREHGEEVQPGTLAVLPPLPAGEPARLDAGALAGVAARTRSLRAWPSIACGRSSSAAASSTPPKISARRAIDPRIPNCSTGWPANTWSAAGACKQMVRLHRHFRRLPAVFQGAAGTVASAIRKTPCSRGSRACACPPS